MIERECLMMDKLDQIIDNMHTIDKKVDVINSKLPYIEKLLDGKISNHGERLDNIEESLTWYMRLLIGTALSAFVALALAIIKFTGGL